MNFFRFLLLIFSFFWYSKKRKITSHQISMLSQKDYALHSGSSWLINRNDSQIRFKDFSINGIFENKKKSEKVHEYSNKFTSQFWRKKIKLPVFLLNNFFFTNSLIPFWNY